MADEPVQNGKMLRKDVMRGVVSLVCLIGFFACMAALLFRIVPDENREIFITGMGIAGGMAVTSNQFWLGSSKGSADKTETLAGK